MTAEFPALGADWRADNGGHNSPVHKLVIHTTEGSTVSGAQGMYNLKKTIHPHLTYDPRLRYGVQHIPVSRAAFSLQSRESPYHSYNRDGVIQIELVGYAGSTRDYPDSWYQNLYHDILRPLMKATLVKPPLTDIPPIYFLPTAGGEGYGMGASQRLSPASWAKYEGMAGHQHVPDNSHWDPGRFRWELVVSLLKPAVKEPPPALFTPPEDTLTMEPDVKARFDRLDAANKAAAVKADLRFKAWSKFRDSTSKLLVRIWGALRK